MAHDADNDLHLLTERLACDNRIRRVRETVLEPYPNEDRLISNFLTLRIGKKRPTTYQSVATESAPASTVVFERTIGGDDSNRKMSRFEA